MMITIRGRKKRVRKLYMYIYIDNNNIQQKQIWVVLLLSPPKEKKTSTFKEKIIFEKEYEKRNVATFLLKIY